MKLETLPTVSGCVSSGRKYTIGNLVSDFLICSDMICGSLDIGPIDDQSPVEVDPHGLHCPVHDSTVGNGDLLKWRAYKTQ